MNDEWIKVDSLIEIDDVAQRIQEIEQEKEIWKSILDNYVIEYKFEIGEHEEKKGDQFCIGKVYTLDLWVKEVYYQLAKEIIDEVKNAPTDIEVWELQNEIPIEEEYEDAEEIIELEQQETSANQKNSDAIFVVSMVFFIICIGIMCVVCIAEILSRPTKDINAIAAIILIFIIAVILFGGAAIAMTKNKKRIGGNRINEYRN